MNQPASPDFETSWGPLRERLRGAGGADYWRSLEELAESPEFQDRLRREFPREAASLSGPINRREFVTLLGAMLALGGLAGCGKPPLEKIVPYTRQPESIVPGKPLYYATAMPFSDGATGLLVRTDMGRPTKIEGNPRHPASLGGPIPWRRRRSSRSGTRTGPRRSRTPAFPEPGPHSCRRSAPPCPASAKGRGGDFGS
jgi:MoCo/4Fe-4S cofactor protein with predicted Tat translocation signal